MSHVTDLPYSLSPLSLCLSVSLSLSLSVSLYVCLCLSFSVSVCICVSVCLCVSICLSLSVSFSLSVSLPPHPPSLSRNVHLNHFISNSPEPECTHFKQYEFNLHKHRAWPRDSRPWPVGYGLSTADVLQSAPPPPPSNLPPFPSPTPPPFL